MSELVNLLYLSSYGEESDYVEYGSLSPSIAQQKTKEVANRRIELRQGDISETTADIIVCSSAVNRLPEGRVVEALERAYQVRIGRQSLSPINRTHRQYPTGTWVFTDKLTKNGREQGLLITAIPGTRKLGFMNGFQKPFDTLINALRDLDQGCLKDEMGNPVTHLEPPTSIAMPILAGNRPYPSDRRMEYIVGCCTDFLKDSKYLNHIEIYIYDQKDVEVWSQHLEYVLKRDLDTKFRFKMDCKVLSNLLRDRLDSAIAHPRTPTHLTTEILKPLHRHLKVEQDYAPCIATLSSFARKSWEAIVLDLCAGEVDSSHQGNLLSAFVKLLDSFFAEEEFVDAWIALSITKSLGNAASHFQFKGRHLTADDYPILLLVLERFVGFVSPFELRLKQRRDDLYRRWCSSIQNELSILELELSKQNLLLKQWNQFRLDDRRTQIAQWFDQVMLLANPQKSHPYWQYRKEGKGMTKSKHIDLMKLKKLASDIIPESVSIHLFIWDLEAIHWEKVNQDWSTLYDVLSRWRLSSFVIDIINEAST